MSQHTKTTKEWDSRRCGSSGPRTHTPWGGARIQRKHSSWTRVGLEEARFVFRDSALCMGRPAPQHEGAGAQTGNRKSTNWLTRAFELVCASVCQQGCKCAWDAKSNQMHVYNMSVVLLMHHLGMTGFSGPMEARFLWVLERRPRFR